MLLALVSWFCVIPSVQVYVNDHPQYVKVVNAWGFVEHRPWASVYTRMKESAEIKPPGSVCGWCVCMCVGECIHLHVLMYSQYVELSSVSLLKCFPHTNISPPSATSSMSRRAGAMCTRDGTSYLAEPAKKG